MAHDDDLWEGDFQEVEFGVPRLRRSSPDRPAAGGGSRWKWAVGGLTVGVAAAIAVAVLGGGDDRAAAPTTSPTTTIGAPTVPELPAMGTTTIATTVPVTTDAPQAPPIRLAVRAADGIAIVDTGSGEARGWDVPALPGAGRVSMVAGADWAILVPVGDTGWFTRPGTEPVALDTGLMRPPGPVFPGPRSRTVWKYDEANGILTLVGPAGEFLGQAVPGADALPVGSDDAGTVVFQSQDAAFLATEAGVAHLTDGTVVGVGPTVAVAVECNDRLGCFNVVIRRSDGRPQMFGTAPLPVDGPLGSVSPPGLRLALVVDTPGQTVVRVIDLGTGAVVAERPVLASTATVWSADGRLLYVVGADAQVHIVDMGDLSDATLFVGSEPVLGIAPVEPADVDY